MGYLDKLLADRETVILNFHRHMVFVILNMIPYVLLTLALWGLATYLTTRTDGTTQQVLVLVLLAGSLFTLGRAVFKFLLWRREEYVITNLRIIQVEGLLNKRTFDSALEKVNDVQMKQSIFGRLFGYGDIEIITGSELGVNKLWGIAKPFDFKRALLEAKIALDRPEHARRAGDHSGEDGFEAARLLAALTDLRDSGVISADEYEQRRRQLLRQP